MAGPSTGAKGANRLQARPELLSLDGRLRTGSTPDGRSTQDQLASRFDPDRPLTQPCPWPDLSLLTDGLLLVRFPDRVGYRCGLSVAPGSRQRVSTPGPLCHAPPQESGRHEVCSASTRTAGRVASR